MTHQKRHITLEVCCADMRSVRAAVQAGAERIELCEDLACGGVSPSLEMIKEAMTYGTALQVLFRPRGGDFVYSEAELTLVCAQISQFSSIVRNDPRYGIVIGALTPQGDIDIEACQRMIGAAVGVTNITFHRAFDECREPLKALEEVIALGCNRLLTSGQAPSAIEGSELIAQLVDRSDGRISVLAGAGVNSHNVLDLITSTGVSEVHGSCRGALGYSSPVEILKIRKIIGNEIL